jgi:hypothetical protein
VLSNRDVEPDQMNVVHVNETNFDQLYAESRCAIKDFLYMLFEISGDCLPCGDWDRAELGEVDPFRYLDIAYEFKYQFRSESELTFLRRAAALNLLCRLARIADEDLTTGSTWMADFRGRSKQQALEAAIREHHPELLTIVKAFEAGRVVPDSAIQRAFKAALYGTDDFWITLRSVTADVVLRTFGSHPGDERTS